MYATRRHRPTRAALLLVLLVPAAAVSGGVVLAAGPAVAAESTNYGIRPADAADHFRLELAPGAASEHTAIVSNRSDRPTTFKVYPADALTTEQGGFALRSPDEPQDGIGVWASVRMQTVTVNPGMEKAVPFRVTVPDHASPGDYAGGIIIEAPPRPGTPGQIRDGTAVQLNVVERVGVRVYLKVSGTARPALSAGALSATDRDGAIVFRLPITNTGNVILEPNVTAIVRAQAGGRPDLRFTTVEALLPGQTTTVQATWQDPPSLVWASVHAVVKHEGGIDRAQTDIRRVPWLPATIIGIASILGLWMVYRAIRTVRAARRLLRRHAALLAPAEHTPDRPAATTHPDEDSVPGPR